MDKKIQEEGINIMEINEEKGKQKAVPTPSQTPQKYLRNSKIVNYSQFLSEEQDNSEDYETPEERKQKLELSKKRQRPKSTTNSNINNKKMKLNKNKDNNIEEEKKDEINSEEILESSSLDKEEDFIINSSNEKYEVEDIITKEEEYEDIMIPYNKSKVKFAPTSSF